MTRRVKLWSQVCRKLGSSTRNEIEIPKLFPFLLIPFSPMSSLSFHSVRNWSIWRIWYSWREDTRRRRLLKTAKTRLSRCARYIWFPAENHWLIFVWRTSSAMLNASKLISNKRKMNAKTRKSWLKCIGKMSRTKRVSWERSLITKYAWRLIVSTSTDTYVIDHMITGKDEICSSTCGWWPYEREYIVYHWYLANNV